MPLQIDPAWQQGSLVPRELFSKAEPVAAGTLGDGDEIIVVSQSCDVICDSIEAEPYADILIARIIVAVEGNNTFGKNPRVIDFQIVRQGGTAQNFRCRDSERLRLDRRIIEGSVPAGLVPPEIARLLGGWTGKRYTRPALPDAFNMRRKPAANRVSKIATKFAGDLTALYVVLNTDRELPEDEAYEVILIGTALAEVATDVSRFARATQAVTELANALNANGVRIISAVTKSEDDVSITDLRSMTRLDLDHISVRQRILDEPTPQS